MGGTPRNVDPNTGEISDEEHVRPFAELLTLLDHGAAHAEASRALHDLVAAVRDTGKAGAMNIKIVVKPVSGSSHQMLVAAVVTAKPPQSDPGAAVFFTDDAGNLVRHDPRQPEIEGLTVVEPKPTRTVTPGVRP